MVAVADWVFLVLLLVSMLIGGWRGLVFEILSLAGWVLSFVVAQWMAADVAALLPLGGVEGTLRYALGFVVVFIASVFACGFFAWLGQKLISAVGLRPADRALGAFFGVLRGVLVLLGVALVVNLASLQGAAWWQESRGAPLLTAGLVRLKPVLPPEFGRHLPSPQGLAW